MLKDRLVALLPRKWWATLKSRQVAFAEGHSIRTFPWLLSDQWEVEERAEFRRLLQGRDAFLDVGANHGFYSSLARHLGKPATAVEPEPSNLVLLRQNARQHGFNVIEAAAGSAPGTLVLYGTGDMASAVKGWHDTSAPRTVPVVTLDDIAPPGRLLVKIDVEGLEADVLDGAAELLARDTVWLIETMDTMPDGTPLAARARVLEIMARHGYQARLISEKGGNWIFTRHS